MNGMQMLLKSMGLDADELQKQYGAVVAGLQSKFVMLENQMTRIEVAQVQILQNQIRLANALKIEGIEDVNSNGPQFRIDFDPASGSEQRDN